MPNFFRCKIVMVGVGYMFLAFFVLKICVTGDLLVDKSSKERILDLIGRGCIFINVSGFSGANKFISFLFCLTLNILGHQWPCGIQSISRIHYEFLKMLNKMFFLTLYQKIRCFRCYFLSFCLTFISGQQWPSGRQEQ